MSDLFVNLVENKKNINNNMENGSKEWRSMIRVFKRVYAPNHECEVYKFFVEAGLNIQEGPAFDNRICLAYMYSKDLFAANAGNFGKALYNAGRDEKILNKIIKCSHSQLLKEIKKISSLLSSKNVKIDPYEFSLDLDALAKTTNHKTEKQVKIQWVEGFFKNGVDSGK